MNNYFSSSFTLGILGGGQLGKMLLYETRKWDINTHVLDPSNEAPAKLACNQFVQGEFTDFDTVYQFGKKVDVLTIEIEHVNVEALEKLEEEGVLVYPSAKTLRVIQNKSRQKLFYKKHKIPTAKFWVCRDKLHLNEHIITGKVTMPFVWKQSAGGYDGMGVKIVRDLDDLIALPDTPCITEDLIDFKNELAVIVARNVNGEIKTYPVVEMEFHPEANQVEYVICPARIPKEVAKEAQRIARTVSEELEHVGLLAVEMFQTKRDKIIVNEMAPRPHNSGHYSIEGSYTNQFEQHLRAILGLPLGNTNNKVAAVMVNLVGAEDFTGEPVYQNLDEILSIKGVTPHIYGKKQTRPFRKMGHVTIVNKDVNKARKHAEKVKSLIKVISK